MFFRAMSTLYITRCHLNFFEVYQEGYMVFTCHYFLYSLELCWL